MCKARATATWLCVTVAVIVTLTSACGRTTGDSKRTRRGHLTRPNAEAMHLNLRGCELRDLGEYDSAMYFFRAALELGRENRLGMRMAAAYQNLGTLYSDRASNSRKSEHAANLDSAIACYDSAARIYSDSGKHTQMVSVITEKAIAYSSDPAYRERADSFFCLARSEAEKRGTALDLGTILYHQAQLLAGKAAGARDLAGLRSAAALLDTAIIFIKKAGDMQFAGSAEMMAEEWRQAIVSIAAKEE
jgi:tetratricopeptide (TPR) repeat protein